MAGNRLLLLAKESEAALFAFSKVSLACIFFYKRSDLSSLRSFVVAPLCLAMPLDP